MPQPTDDHARPRASLALMPEVFDEVFPLDVLERLRRSVRLPDPEPMDDFSSPRAQRQLAHTEILVTGWGCPRIDADILQAAPNLKAVIHAAGSVKHHVDEVVFDRGIAVSSAAEANSLPVAQYTVSMCVLAAKHAFGLAQAYAAGQDVHNYQPGRSPSMHGATIGIIGASRIGRLVIGMLRDHDVSILVYDPYLTSFEARELGAEKADLDKLCADSDIVSVHAPETSETVGMIGERQLSLMRDGTVVINTARGALLDTEALRRHCETGRLDAVLDVTEPEPLPLGHPLLHLPNVVVTPHLAGAKGREVRRLGEYAVGEVERFVHGRRMRGRVAVADLARTA